MVPTIARGVKLGEDAKNLALRFRRGTKSLIDFAALSAGFKRHRVNSLPDMEFEPMLGDCRPSCKNVVKKACRLYLRPLRVTPLLYHAHDDTAHFLPYSER